MLHDIYQRNKLSHYEDLHFPSCIKNDSSNQTLPIAPATVGKHLSLDLKTDLNRKIYSYKSNSYTGPQAASIARRNARERNRVQQVNEGFNALRKRLPATIITALSGGSRRGSGKKLSKVDTLRMVVEYIRYLESIIDESDTALGIKKDTRTAMEVISYDVDGFVFRGTCSPYSECAPSPAGSECSSGVSSAYSSAIPNGYQTCEDLLSPMDNGGMIDAISW